MKQTIALLFAAWASAGVLAQDALDALGKVTKIDAAAGKLTIDHGPVKSLDMPAMTMVYRAGDGVALNDLKPGDRIRFAAGKVDGQYTVLRLEKAK